jgi:hypothetical protein
MNGATGLCAVQRREIKVYSGLVFTRSTKQKQKQKQKKIRDQTSRLSSIIATERIDLRRARSLRQHQRVGGTSQFTDQMHRSDVKNQWKR